MIFLLLSTKYGYFVQLVTSIVTSAFGTVSHDPIVNKASAVLSEHI